MNIRQLNISVIKEPNAKLTHRKVFSCSNKRISGEEHNDVFVSSGRAIPTIKWLINYSGG